MLCSYRPDFRQVFFDFGRSRLTSWQNFALLSVARSERALCHVCLFFTALCDIRCSDMFAPGRHWSTFSACVHAMATNCVFTISLHTRPPGFESGFLQLWNFFSVRMSTVAEVNRQLWRQTWGRFLLRQESWPGTVVFGRFLLVRSILLRVCVCV